MARTIRIPKNEKRTPDQIANEIKRALKQVGSMAAKRMKEPTQTWKHQVGFAVEEPRLIGDDLVCNVYTEDDPYFFVDAGTRVRYATMTPDFIPKTKPRKFQSGAGRGGLRYWDRMVPRPGIEKREWTVLTALEFGPVAQSVLDQIIADYTPKMPLSSKEFHSTTHKA